MVQLSKWIKKALDTFVDPDKQSRIEMLTRTIEHGLQSQRQNFSLQQAIRDLEHSPGDLQIATESVYRSMLERGWQDGKLSLSQQEIARWAAERLGISSRAAKEINTRFAKLHFAAALAKAMEDGVLEDHEEAELRQIAAAIGVTMPNLMRAFFHTEGEAFLRGVFLACIADGELSKDEWSQLLSTTKRLGITKREMLQAVQPQARQFVEHVLADAKEDGRLSNHEDATLNWLVENLGLPPDYQLYVAREVEELRLLTEIQQGILPVIPPPDGVAVKSGEIVHFNIEAIWRYARQLKSGIRYDDHQGLLTLTDTRLIFSSYTKSQTINYRRIVSYYGYSSHIELQLQGKPIYTFYFSTPSPLPPAIFESAVEMVNQTLVKKIVGPPNRHIPRDIRQRVWQRYGGRCAECNADDYLEFDHIIPIAKGGSNSEANIQLLCRRCNLKKSDHI